MDDSKIFIVGANGQLGKALQTKYPNAKKADIDELDITSRDSVQAFDWTGVEIILNAAAFTNVDGAETPEGRVAAWNVNAKAVSYLAEVAQHSNAILVHISSDYVFNGTKTPHTEDEKLAPLSVYGASKAAGDIAAGLVPKHYLLRTSWVIGDGKNFVRTMMELGQKGVSPSVVSDQIGRLTFTHVIVDAIDYLLTNNLPFGTYNVSNDGPSASWADIARRIFELASISGVTVADVTTEQYYRGKSGIAPRPLQSTLDLSKIASTGFKPTDWQTDLKSYVEKELKP